VSREGGIVLNNLLLATATATVFLGTLYPLFLDAIGAGKVSVGAPFFNATFVPLMVPLLAALVAGPLLSWKRADLAGILGRLKLAFAAAFAVALGVWWLRTGGPTGAVLGMALAAWVFAGTLVEWAERVKLFRAPPGETWRRVRGLPRSAWGMTVAHLGVAVVAAGVTASAWQSERVERMRPGDTIEIAGYEITFEGTTAVEGPNYSAERGRFTVTRDGAFVAVMQPEKRFYPVQRMPITNAAIRTNLLADLYAVIADPVQGERGAWIVRLYHNPLVPWIWIGALIMALGGVVSITDRKFRVGAPARRTAPAAAVPAKA
jgi:cytochrome c-type biogenesis protein CcmF